MWHPLINPLPSNMKTTRFFLLGLMALFMTPLVLQAAKSTSSPALPSTHLRQMVDTTLPRISSLTNTKQKPNRGAIVAAQTEWTALALTAPPERRATYAAAANVAQELLGAIDEHDKAVATYHYSRSVHGAQDRQNMDISNALEAPGTARANNAKQNKENADNRKALLQKEEFMSKGVIADWTTRLPQISTAVEQAFAAELVTEKQMVAARTAPPPVPPATQPSAAQTYSPAGTWTGPKGQWTLTDDGNFVTSNRFKGTWQWGDRTKRELSLKWKNGGVGKAVFSADGKSLEVTMPNGGESTLTR
jgi:hypothetical protein